MDSMIDEHTKTLVADDQLMSKNSKSWCNSGRMKKTKSENGSAPIVTANTKSTIIMTQIGLGITMLGTLFE